MGIQHHGAVCVVSGIVNLLEKQFDSQLTHPIPRQTHGGHGNTAFGGEVIVVVANDNQVIGYPDAEPGCGLNHSDGEQI